MSGKSSKRIRELENHADDMELRLGVVEQFMVRILQIVNDKHSKDTLVDKVSTTPSNSEGWTEPTSDVEEFEDA